MDENVQVDKPDAGSKPAEKKEKTAVPAAVTVAEMDAEVKSPSAKPEPPPAPVAPPSTPSGNAEAKAEEPKPATADQQSAEPARRMAFVIEDDYDASEIFGKAMEANGLSFEVIHTGNRAIERLDEAEPDIVVLDMHLPNVDGSQILAHIRKTERLAKTLVIVVTADARVGELVKGVADLVVLKPATYTQVRDFASRLLRRQSMS